MFVLVSFSLSEILKRDFLSTVSCIFTMEAKSSGSARRLCPQCN